MAVSGKKKLVTTEQLVLMKREFQKSTENGFSKTDNVIYKLDCKTLNKKEQNLIYVNTKKMYDEIEKDCSYKFTIERRQDKRWYLLSHEKLASESVVLKPLLSMQDFEDETEALVNFYVEGAYACNDAVKIFGYVNVFESYKQCDLVIKVTGSSCFQFESHETKNERIRRALSKIYNEMLNKWFVFHVTCKKTYNKNYTLIVRDDTVTERSDVNDDVSEPVANLSYTNNKHFKLTEVLRVSLCEHKGKNEGVSAPRIQFEMSTQDNDCFVGSKFLSSNDDVQEILSDVNSINFNIEAGFKVYCVYSMTTAAEKSYVNVVSMVLKDDDDDVSSLFSG